MREIEMFHATEADCVDQEVPSERQKGAALVHPDLPVALDATGSRFKDLLLQLEHEHNCLLARLQAQDRNPHRPGDNRRMHSHSNYSADSKGTFGSDENEIPQALKPSVRPTLVTPDSQEMLLPGDEYIGQASRICGHVARLSEGDNSSVKTASMGSTVTEGSRRRAMFYLNKQDIVPSVFAVWLQYTRDMNRTISFNCIPAWEHSVQTNTMMHSSVARSSVSALNSHLDGLGAHQHSSFVVHPTSPFRLAWELLGALAILYDVVMIPLSAYGIQGGVLTSIEWVILVMWTLDVPFSMITGFIRRGKVVMSIKAIAKNYATTWATFDVCLLSADWISLMMISSESDDLDFRRLFRTLRSFRFVRLLRLAKMKKIINHLEDYVASESVFVMGTVFQQIMAVIIISHMLSSVFYVVGTSGSSGEDDWLTKYEIMDKDLGYRYLTSLHYTLTQFTPASIEIQPTNSKERVFAVALLMLGLGVFSSIIGTMTASLQYLSSLSSKRGKELWVLRRYLRANKVEGRLTYRIIRFIEYMYEMEANSIPEVKVNALGKLSKELMTELRYGISFACLKHHPLFDELNSASRTVRSLTSAAISILHLAAGDLVFSSSTKATCMHCTLSGLMSYQADSAVSLIERGMWLSEAALWTHWWDCGTAEAQDECQLVNLNADAVAIALHKDPVSYKLASRYAAEFVAFLNETKRRNLTDAMINREEVFGLLSSAAQGLGVTLQRRATVYPLGRHRSEDST